MTRWQSTAKITLLAVSTLLSMLQRAGRLAPADAARVADFAGEQRTSEIDALVRLGVGDEAGLVQFLHSKLLIPVVDSDVLSRIDPDTLAALPAELAWDLVVLPVSVDDANNLTLAMADPTDERAVEIIATHTGAYLIRAVARLQPLREAIYRHYGPRPARRDGPPTPHAMPPSRAPMDTDNAAPLSAAAFARAATELAAASDRDAILGVLTEFLAAGYQRVIVFLHLHQQLRGRDARGPDLLRDAVTQVRIPTGPPSLFSEIIAAGAPRLGPWTTDRPIDKAFSDALGQLSGDTLLLPLRLREHVPVVVFACGPTVAVDPATLRELAEAAGHALERLIFHRKSRGNPPDLG